MVFLAEVVESKYSLLLVVNCVASARHGAAKVYQLGEWSWYWAMQ